MHTFVRLSFSISRSNWPSRLLALAVVILFAGVGSILLLPTHATTPTASTEPETGTINAPASQAADTTASSSQAVKFTSNTGSTKPDATNTGVPANTSLATINGNVTITTDGTILDGKDIKGLLTISANNVTVRNTLVEGGSTGSFRGIITISSGTGTVLDHVTVAPTQPLVNLDGIWGQDFTAQYVNVRGGVDGFKAGPNATIKNSYIHDLAWFANDPSHNGGPTHNDTIQILGGTNITVQDNNLVATVATSGQWANSAIQITQDDSAVSNVTVQRNWADGGGCTFNISYSPLSSLNNIFVYNNRFGRNTQYANCPILIGTKVTLTQSGNVYDNNSQPIGIQQHD